MEKKTHGGAREGAGRPKGTTGAYKEIKRDKNLNIRVFQSDLELINECSQILSLSKANVVMKAIKELHKTITK